MQRIKKSISAIVMMLALALVMAVPAFAQDLGSAASGGATTGVGYALGAAVVVIGFSIGYKLVKKVTGG